MRVDEAKAMVLALMHRDVERGQLDLQVNSSSPDPLDEGKFVIDGRPARVIHHFDGWYVPVDLGWFAGDFEPPRIQRGVFHWYVFAIPRLRKRERDHYFICDYLQLRQWVLEFAAPLGNDHRDHSNWRADLRIINESRGDGYFRWGDEPVNFVGSLTRSFRLDNVSTIAQSEGCELAIGSFGGTGESEAHRLLKLYVVRHPRLLGLSSNAQGETEHVFRTGDRVDVFFRNHEPERTVVEIEVEGRDNLLTGIHQALKYRTLAEAADDYPLQSPRVRACLVAYDTDFAGIAETAARYDVMVHEVDRREVLLHSS